MSSSHKKLAIGAAIVVAAFILVLLLLTVLFPTDLVRDRAVAALENRLKLPVTVQGARFSVFPSLGADLTGVEIGEKDVPGRPRIEIASLHLRVRVLPLLRRDIEITRVDVDGFNLDYLLADGSGAGTSSSGKSGQRSSGSPNTESRTPGTTGGNPGSTAGGSNGSTGPAGEQGGGDVSAERSSEKKSGFELKVDALSLRDGRVRVRSADGAPLLELGGISEDIEAEATSAGDLSLSGQTRIDSLRLHLPAGDLGQGLRLQLDKILSYNRASDSLAIEKADLDLNGLPVSIRGIASGVSAGRPTIDIELQGGPGEVSDILGYLPSALFPEMEGSKSSGTISINGSVNGSLAPDRSRSKREKLDYTVELTLSDGHIELPSLQSPIDRVELSTTATPNMLNIEDLFAESGTSRVRARAKISDYGRSPNVDAALDLDLNLEDVAGLRSEDDDHKMRGRVAAQLSLKGPAKHMDRMRVAGIVDLKSVSYEGKGTRLPIDNVNGRVLVQDKIVTLQKLDAAMGSSDFSVQGTLSDYAALSPEKEGAGTARIDLFVRSNLLALDELTSLSAEDTGEEPHPDRGSPGDGDRSARGAGTVAGPLGALTGKIEFRANHVRTKETETGAAAGVATLDRGLIRIDSLELEAFGGQAAAYGTVDYRNPAKPHLDIKAQISRMRASDLLSASKSLNRLSRMGGFLSGEVDANATIKGDLNEAKNLDLGTLTSIGDLTLHKAKLKDHPLQARLASFLETPQLSTLEISDWFQPFRIENGRVNVEDLSIKTERIALSASGWQSLDGSIELALEVLLPEELSAGIRKQVPTELAPVLFGGDTSHILVPLQLTGSYESPRVAVDTGRLTAEARARAQQKLADERRRLEEEARRRARGFLDGLIKTPADTTSDKKKTGDLEEGVKKSLKDLFKKKK